MPKASPALPAFTSGEISEIASARIDLDAYARALSRCENFIPLVQGPVTRRFGERYVTDVRDATAAVRLIPFVFSDDDAVMLVLNDGYIRFFVDHAPVLSGMSVYEVAHPWADADLRDLDFVQSADVIYVVHPDYAPRKISRNSATNWTISTLTFDDGPFVDENIVTTTWVQASVLTGSGTLTSNSAIFDPDHVGGLMLIWASDLTPTSNLSPWEPGKAYAATTEYTYYNGRIYRCTANPNESGTVPPSHDEGTRWDGRKGDSCAWLFVSSLYGVVRITGYTNSTTVSMTVLQTIPICLSGNIATRFAFGAWSDFYGYPSCITFYQDRLVMAGSESFPDTIWMSATGDYENFAPRDSGGLVTADLAVSVTVSSQAVNEVRAITPDGTGLYCNSSGGEFLIAPSTANEPLSQSNVRCIPQTTVGGARIKPLKLGAATIFVQKGGIRIREALYAYDNDRYQAPDLTLLNPTVLATPAVAIAWQQEPYSLIWACLEDGTLSALTYDRENQVVGGHRHALGGTDAAVLDIAVIPSPDGTLDDVWTVTERVVDGDTVLQIGFLDASWRISGDAADAFYVDAGVTQTGAASTITGLAHLEGETVQVWADGAFHPDCVVSGGSITLDGTYTTRTAGLEAKARGRTMRIEAGSADGTAQGKTKRISHATFRLFNSLSFLAGSDASMDRIEMRTSSQDVSAAVTPFTGDTSPMAWPEGYETDGYISFETDQAGPVTISGIWPTLQTFDK